MINISLLSQKVQEVHLVNKLDKPGQVQLDSSFSLNVNFLNDGKHCVGRLQQTLRDKEMAGGKFTLSIELTGVFSCEGAVDDETKRQVHAEVYNQLFPFMQCQCAALTASSGIPGLMLRRATLNADNITVNRRPGPDGGNDRNPDGGPKLTLL